MPGDATTIDEVTGHGFSGPAPNLSAARLDFHPDDDRAFAEQFVRAPSVINPGLGPVFNETSCEGCQVADGRTRDTFLRRLSLPGADEVGGPLPVPGFGTQLQDEAVFRVAPEGRIDTQWEESVVVLDDGTPVSLRRPIQTVRDPYTPLPDGVLTKGTRRVGLTSFVADRNATLDTRVQSEMQAAPEAVEAIRSPFRNKLDAQPEIDAAIDALNEVAATLQEGPEASRSGGLAWCGGGPVRPCGTHPLFWPWSTVGCRTEGRERERRRGSGIDKSRASRFCRTIGSVR